MTDRIANLPETNDPMSPEELNMMREIFQAGSASVEGVKGKNLIIYGVLFFVLNLPIVDRLIKGFVDTTDIVLLALKAMVFILIIYILQVLNI